MTIFLKVDIAKNLLVVDRYQREDDEDRLIFLRTLAEVVRRFHWLCHAYCQLLVETPDGNLSKGMRHLNGVHTQATNRRHTRTGHLFQGRFKGQWLGMYGRAEPC